MFSWRQLIRASDWKGQRVSFVQQKFDGVRVLLEWQGEEPTAFTRNGKTNLWPAIQGRIPALKGCALDCELICDGPSTDVISNVVNGKPITAVVFAAPVCKDLILQAKLKKMHLQPGGSTAYMDGLRIAKASPFRDEVDYSRIALESGWEGFVLKHGFDSGWFKLKPFRRADLLVVDVTLSTSKTQFGMIKALKVADSTGRIVASVGSGFEKEWRASARPADLRGQIVEVEYDCVAGQGRLRFPRFVRFRPDKDRPDTIRS